MYLAQWSDAATDVSRTLEGSPDNIEMHFQRLSALLIGGDESGYREARIQALQHFKQTDNWFVAYLAVRMSALASASSDESNNILRFVDTMLKKYSGNPPSLHTVAIANYRAGHVELSVEKALAALVAKPDWDAQVLNHLVLALAYNKLSNAAEARRHYDVALKWIEAAQALPLAKNPQRYGTHPVDWLTCLILCREAETELGIEPKAITPY